MSTKKTSTKKQPTKKSTSPKTKSPKKAKSPTRAKSPVKAKSPARAKTPTVQPVRGGGASTGAQRHRKILRDNIAGITKPAIRRILRRAGVLRISGLVYEETRGVLKTWLEKIVKDMIIFKEYDRRKTVQTEDLEAALDSNGIALAAGINQNAKKTASLQSCNSRGKSSSSTKKAPAAEGEEKKTHRFKPGTVARRDIKNQQKSSDCLAIPKLNFERLVREIAQDFEQDVRFSSPVFGLLQLAAEDYLIDIFECANLCAIHANRETLFPKDIQLVRLIKENR